MDIALALTLLQTIIQDAPEAIALFDAVKAVLTSGADPTSAQWAAIVQAQAAAHLALQGKPTA